MNNTLKLLIPLGLGVAAACLNWWALENKIAPVNYVKVKEGIRAGERFREDNLDKLAFRGDEGSLKETAVPYRHRAVLYNTPSLRDLKKGDLVLWRDIHPHLETGEDQLPISLEGVSVVHPRLLAVGNEVVFVIDREASKSTKTGSSSTESNNSPARSDFRYIGPFRIVTVDGQVARAENSSGRGGQRLITVAVRREGENGSPDAKTRLLLEALKGRKEGRHRFVEMILNAPH